MTGQRQREITEWADAAFGGPWTSNARGVARILEEVAELVTAVTTNASPERVAGECADVMICAFRLAAVVIDVLALTLRTLLRTVGSHEHGVVGVLGGIALRLHALCVVVEHDLLAEVDAKMEINRRREWVPDGTGCGRHVKTTGATTT